MYFIYGIEVYGPTLCTFCQHSESEGCGGVSGKPNLCFGEWRNNSALVMKLQGS